MTASEKKFVERNLDLIFEFEKYVLEHPAIAEKIPREAVERFERLEPLNCLLVPNLLAAIPKSRPGQTAA
jgi:Family of unknown function (DUF5647)